MLDLLESSSVLVPELNPPMRSVPAGLCQETWFSRSSVRWWDCSHSPLKVRQLVFVPKPPHAVREDCECFLRPGEGRSGSLQLRPLGRITSAICEASPVGYPPVTSNPEENTSWSTLVFQYFTNSLATDLVALESLGCSWCPRLLEQ